MFDTGYTRHTNWGIETEEESDTSTACSMGAKAQLGIVDAIRGVHDARSIIDEYARKIALDPSELSLGSNEKMFQNFSHAFMVDQHEPFSTPEMSRTANANVLQLWEG